jgi:predicted Zn-dependent protease
MLATPSWISTASVSGNSNLRAMFLRVLAPAILLAAAFPHASAHGTHSSLMALLDERLAKQPENGRLWFQRALLQFEHDDWAAASQDLAKAELLAPGEFPVRWWQGKILDQEGKPQQAKVVLDAFLTKSPDHSGALASRARVETKLGLHKEALDDFRAALANQPDAGPDLIQETAQALATQGNTDESIRVLETGSARLGNVPSLQLSILEIEVNAGRFESALARLKQLEQSAPRPEPWMEKRASILAEAGRPGESNAAWRALIAHLNALPAAERSSHSMTLLSERARQAVAALASSTTPAKPLVFISPPRP